MSAPRIAIVGSSHVACLRDALTAAGELPGGINVTLYALPGRGIFRHPISDGQVLSMPESESEDAREKARQINGATSIDLSEYDHVLLAGHPSGNNELARIAASCDVAGLRETGQRTLLSAPGFAALLAAGTARIMPAPQWDKLADGKLTLFPQALPSSDCLTDDLPLFAPYREAAENPDGLEQMHDTLQRLWADHLSARGMQYLPQPQGTRLPSLTTRAEHSRGSTRIYQPNVAKAAEGSDPAHIRTHGDQDFIHMNAGFGAMALRDWFRQLNLHDAADQIGVQVETDQMKGEAHALGS